MKKRNSSLNQRFALQLHAAAQAYTSKVKGKDGVQSGSGATSHDEGDLYFVNPNGEFIASYGPSAEPKEIGKEFSDVMKVSTVFSALFCFLLYNRKSSYTIQKVQEPAQIKRLCRKKQ